MCANEARDVLYNHLTSDFRYVLWLCLRPFALRTTRELFSLSAFYSLFTPNLTDLSIKQSITQYNSPFPLPLITFAVHFFHSASTSACCFRISGVPRSGLNFSRARVPRRVVSFSAHL